MDINQGVIMKSTKEGFVSPQTSVSGFTSDLLTAWQRDPLSLEEWGEVFRLATKNLSTTRDTQADFSQEDLEKIKVASAEALGFKTPSRLKRKAKEEPGELYQYQRTYEPGVIIPPTEANVAGMILTI